MTDETVRNVFILSADSLSYPYFAEYAAEIADTLDAVNFRNAIAPASNTRCSAPGLHAGIFSDSDLLDGPELHIPKRGPPTTVAECFRDAGYETGFWTPNHIFGNANNYDRGFTHGNKGKRQLNKRIADLLKEYETERLFDVGQTLYFYGLNPLLEKIRGREEYIWAPAEVIQNDALDWFERNDPSSVFCWLHYMDSHHPFEAPEEYLESISLNRDWDREDLSFFTRDAIKTNAEGLSRDEISDVEKAYEASCRYLRDQQRSFIDALLENDHYDPERDVLCITSDHGEAFTPEKHGLMGHASFFEEIIRVPLIISHPSWEGRVIDEQVSLIDVMPTILDSAGLSVPNTFEGQVCNSPSDFYREYAYVIDGNPVRRAIRGNGQKLFAHRLGESEDGFEVVCTEYEQGNAVGEEIISRMTTEEFTELDLDILPDGFRDLQRRIQRERGGVLQ